MILYLYLHWKNVIKLMKLLNRKIDTFLEEWKALYDSKSGERGIYNRDGIRKKTKKIGKRDADLVVGTNPSGYLAA